VDCFAVGNTQSAETEPRDNGNQTWVKKGSQKSWSMKTRPKKTKRTPIGVASSNAASRLKIEGKAIKILSRRESLRRGQNRMVRQSEPV